MACPTGRCALRRFDGHGTGSYRPTNSALAAEGEAKLAAMLAERRAVDAMFGGAERQHLAETAPVRQPLAQAERQMLSQQHPTPSLPGITPWKTPSASASVTTGVDKMRLTHK